MVLTRYQFAREVCTGKGVLDAFFVSVRTRFRENGVGVSYWVCLRAVTRIVAVAFQSVFEFSLQMPGNAALFAVLCGIVLHSASQA